MKRFNVLHQVTELKSNLQCSHTADIKFEELLSFLSFSPCHEIPFLSCKISLQVIKRRPQVTKLQGSEVVRIKGINSKKSGKYQSDLIKCVRSYFCMLSR